MEELGTTPKGNVNLWMSAAISGRAKAVISSAV
jgi:hypothetical protein